MQIRVVRYIIGLLTLTVSTPFSFSQASQGTAERDTRALSVAEHCLSVAGGSTSIMAIKDFMASGKITYYWTSNPVEGEMKIRAIGTSDFRVDAKLPDGNRAWTVVSGNGAIRESDGTTRVIPPENSHNLGALSFPILKLFAELHDPSTAFVYKGTTDVDGHEAFDIQMYKSAPSKAVHDAMRRLTAYELFIDKKTLQIVRLRDSIHPTGRATQDITHEVEFSQYRATNGVMVPFVVSERVNGQLMWTMLLDEIVFGVGLSDIDFQI